MQFWGHSLRKVNCNFSRMFAVAFGPGVLIVALSKLCQSVECRGVISPH